MAAVAAGAGAYYAQVYGFYQRLDAAPVRLAPDAEPIAMSDFRAIDADSSPLRFRACFRTGARGAVPYPDATPLTAPRWFDCFDARTIGADLAAGRAEAFLSERDIHPGVDRVVAIYPDGRAYAWQQLNDKAGE